MKGRQIVIGTLQGREIAMLLEDGRLLDMAVSPQDKVQFGPGAILRGKVNRLVKGQGGVFVSLPDAQSGYLRETSGMRPGQEVVVQVSGTTEPGKAIPLSLRLLIKGRYGIATPGAPGVNVSRSIREPNRRAGLQIIGEAALGDRKTGLIVRSAAIDADDRDISAELAELAELAVSIASDGHGEPQLLLSAPTPEDHAWTEWGDPPADTIERLDGPVLADLEDAVLALLSPDFDLGGAGHAYIEPTRALTAIDVNTGANTSPAAALKANIAVARELPRQLRLRGLGGQIVVDFAPISKRDRGTVEQELKKAFRADGPETVLSGWTALGLFELTRKRDRIPLSLLFKAN